MPKEIIESAYEMIGGHTPLKIDCGQICDFACCHSEGYMILFPYEEEFFVGKGFNITLKELPGYGPIYAASCEGTCKRENRPLSCRIFPLAPKVVKGEVFVRLDPRGRNVCPLTHNSILSLDKEFTNTIKKTLNYLNGYSKMSAFLKAVSRVADEYTNIL